MEGRLRDRLEHILAAIAAIETYTAGKQEADFTADRLLIDAVEGNIERISEASRHIPETLKAKYPHLPWRAIAGIGNILRHDSPHIKPVEIWWTVVRDLVELKAVVTAMLREVDGQRT
ncbi:MAG: DUF86 domain-containing protein [Rhodospirillales bacterium]|nr:DUF86 domain-containing protein [Rhodospirillales bacterium]